MEGVDMGIGTNVIGNEVDVDGTWMCDESVIVGAECNCGGCCVVCNSLSVSLNSLSTSGS